MLLNAEHRGCNRSPIQGKTQVRLLNGVVVEGEAVDISLLGMLFHSERCLPVGKSVRVALFPESELSPFRIDAGGFVVRLHDQGVAVRFTDMSPDTRQYLREEVLTGAPKPRVSEGYAF